MKGICPITRQEDDIRKSHIYPQFMWKYLKKTGGTVFRSVSQPTKVLQNGDIRSLLGSKAEEMFSKRELWFEKNIFTPYINGQLNNRKVYYSDELYYFCVSLLWRVLFINKDNIFIESLNKICNEVLEDWRSYLNFEVPSPTKYYNIYLMPLSANILSLPDGISDIDFYLKRSFDSNVMRSLNSDDKAVYCK